MKDRPFDHEFARRAARPALEVSGADAVEVLFAGSTIGLTRYATSQIIQNTVQETARAHVRVAIGKRISSASTNRFDPESMRSTAEQARDAARASPDDHEFPGFPDPDDVGRAEGLSRFDEDTAATPAERRARGVRSILKVTEGCETAGIFETSAHAFAVLSTSGIDCYDSYSRCVVSCLADLGGSSGYREASSPSISDVDPESVARTAFDKAASSRDPRDAPAGTYEVVLEPNAVALLLEYLSYTGFGAKQVIEGESFLSGRAGQMVAAPSVTVADDVHHPRAVGIGFDFEGVPRRRVAVIDEGKAIGPVTDLRTARRLGTTPSGHYSGSNEFGPYASNLVMEPGDATSEELIAGVEDGLLVTRFHYVNVLDRPATLLTGMTRDGTWRIRKGEVAEAVHNLRFTQSVLDLLASVRRSGRDLEAFGPDFGSFGSTVAPAVQGAAFDFTSVTSH